MPTRIMGLPGSRFPLTLERLQPAGRCTVTRKPATPSRSGRKSGARRPRSGKGGGPTLTPREIDVLRLLALGCSYAEAATQLGVSPNTVTSHVKNAYRKLDVHTAAAAVMRAVELRLIRPLAL